MNPPPRYTCDFPCDADCDAGCHQEHLPARRRHPDMCRCALRRQYAAAIREAADYSIVGEWICCDPVNPDHELCFKADIARQMLAAVLADDPDRLFVPSRLADAVMAINDQYLQAAHQAIDQLNRLRADEYFATRERGIKPWREYSAHWRERARKAEAGNDRVRKLADKRGVLNPGLRNEMLDALEGA
ncbi:hypothetical protein [Nonomuraea sediminis]|uniref:hypothetical protein n=1 Tax=Nonomuraea sediminis TaxID=2835864 RepID=UPI001BDC3341|nr:hypothetical protein [Nonomuraea sediminis]